MITCKILIKNFFKGMVLGIPFWVCGVIASAISCTHTHEFEIGSIILAALLCGLFAGEICCNIYSLFEGELIDAICKDIMRSQAKKAKKAAKTAQQP